MRFVYKLTSELTAREVQDTLDVLNVTIEGWGGQSFFRWRYVDNPYGVSLYAIGYDGDQPGHFPLDVGGAENGFPSDDS